MSQTKAQLINGKSATIEFTGGSASAPAVSFTGDTNTGIYSPGADQVAISTNGTGRLFVNSSGSVGIGTSSVATPLQVRGTNATTNFTINNTSGFLTLQDTASSAGAGARIAFGCSYDGTNSLGQAIIGASKEPGTGTGSDQPRSSLVFHTSNFASGVRETMRLDPDGRLGIGTSSPTGLLTVAATSPVIDWTNSSNTAFKHSIESTGYSGSAAGNTLAFKVASGSSTQATVMTLDGAGRVLVGSSTAAINLASGAIQSGAGHSSISNTGSLTPPTLLTSGSLEFNLDGVSGSQRHGRITGNGDTSGGAYAGGLDFEYYADKGSGYQWYRGLRLTSGGTVSNKTSNIGSEVGQGWSLTSGGEGLFTVPNICLYVNRTSSDGTLITFFQDNTQEGTISVSGTTVSYNGGHLSRWSQIPGIDSHDKTKRPEILRGTVMSNLDEMCDWINPNSGNAQDNEQLNKTKISDVEGDKNVAGIFQSWDDDDDTWVNDYYLAMTGDFIIRIAAGVTVKRGDLLMSAGDGTAKPQGDGFVQDKTIAKVTSTNVTCTYDDGSYCVPCVLMAC